MKCKTGFKQVKGKCTKILGRRGRYKRTKYIKTKQESITKRIWFINNIILVSIFLDYAIPNCQYIHSPYNYIIFFVSMIVFVTTSQFLYHRREYI